jgi:hypothetical protein
MDFEKKANEIVIKYDTGKKMECVFAADCLKSNELSAIENALREAYDEGVEDAAKKSDTLVSIIGTRLSEEIMQLKASCRRECGHKMLMNDGNTCVYCEIIKEHGLQPGFLKKAKPSVEKCEVGRCSIECWKQRGEITISHSDLMFLLCGLDEYWYENNKAKVERIKLALSKEA